MQTRYRSARTSLLIFDIMTWISVIILTLIAVKLFLSGTLITSALLGVGIWLFAIFEFAFTQFARAQIDTADNTKRILDILAAKHSIPGSTTANAPTIAAPRREPTITR